MSWFKNTISDKDWDKIRRGANKTETREGGMFGKEAVARRKIYSRNLAQKDAN
jgi:hypothetical protein